MSEPTPALDAQAQALYEACQTVKPTWAQLEETTRDVWRGYVLSGLSGGVLL
jgi:hypothetical protein